MPAAFFGHGSPMNALDRNRYTEAWRAFGQEVATPRAILVVSAHWYINATAVTAMAAPRTIHDFYGFPDELFAVQYPAPGSPEFAREVAEVAQPTWVGFDADSWGIDHGTWSVLLHAFPDAQVPVVQLSVNAQRPFQDHVDLGSKLVPLAESGVLIVASGNVVHNLRRVDWARADGGEAWAHSFDDAARQVLVSDPASIVRLGEHEAFELAVPTPDHFIPLLYFAGFAAGSGRRVETLVEGCSLGSISMTSYAAGCTIAEPVTGVDVAVAPPQESVPPEETNL